MLSGPCIGAATGAKDEVRMIFGAQLFRSILSNQQDSRPVRRFQVTAYVPRGPGARRELNAGGARVDRLLPAFAGG
jgi:hypothetical protein